MHCKSWKYTRISLLLLVFLLQMSDRGVSVPTVGDAGNPGKPPLQELDKVRQVTMTEGQLRRPYAEFVSLTPSVTQEASSLRVSIRRVVHNKQTNKPTNTCFVQPFARVCQTCNFIKYSGIRVLLLVFSSCTSQPFSVLL